MSKIIRFIRNLFHEYHVLGCSSLAASLAYSTLLSLVPLMIVSFTVLSYFPLFKGAGEVLQAVILKNFVAGSAAVLTDYFNAFLKQIAVLHWYNLVSLLTVTILMIYNMVRSFNRIWHAKMRYRYGLSFLIYLIVLLATPLAFASLLLMSSYLASLPMIKDTALSVYVEKPGLIFLPYAASFICFTFMNWVLPSVRVRLWPAVLAGFVTTLFFEIAKYGFSIYLRFVPTYRLIYGALATIPLFLIWLYVCWFIILLGALMCAQLSKISST